MGKRFENIETVNNLSYANIHIVILLSLCCNISFMHLYLLLYQRNFKQRKVMICSLHIHFFPLHYISLLISLKPQLMSSFQNFSWNETNFDRRQCKQRFDSKVCTFFSKKIFFPGLLGDENFLHMQRWKQTIILFWPYMILHNFI